MRPNVLKVIFEVEASKTENRRFTVPTKAAKALGLQADDWIELEIWSHAGLTTDVYKMASGTEVYQTKKSNKGLRKVVSTGERLLITASRPAKRPERT